MKKKYRSLRPILDVSALTHPHDFDQHLDQDCHQRVLEIGFGTGEFIVGQACQYPATHFLGVEKNIARIFKTANKVVDQQLNNVHLIDCDAVVFLKRFVAEQCLHEVVCLFPCPWPKKGHVKNRLFSRAFFSLLSSRLQDGGRVLLVTDYRDYADWVYEEWDRGLFDLDYQVTTADFDTKFERKWKATGQRQFYQFKFTKKEHVSVPVDKGVPLRVFFANQCDPNALQHQELSEHGVHIKILDTVVSRTEDHILVLAVASEEHLMQHCWIEIKHVRKGWRVGVARGSNVLACASIAKTVSFIYDLIK